MFNSNAKGGHGPPPPALGTSLNTYRSIDQQEGEGEVRWYKAVTMGYSYVVCGRRSVPAPGK